MLNPIARWCVVKRRGKRVNVAMHRENQRPLFRIYWLRGIRHRGGMISVRAFTENVGTYIMMLREPCKHRSTVLVCEYQGVI